MYKALAVKELRETAGIGLVALIFLAVYTGQAMGLRVLPWSRGYDQTIPFVTDQLLATYMLIAGCLAAALGLRQSALETAFGTDQFLLHRPLSRAWIVGMKVIVGVGLYLAITALPILVYAWWAATPGTHASPFEWSMTLGIWKGWLALTVVYLGALLSGIRPGRWHGTRLLPLVATAFLALVLGTVPWLWAWGVAAVVVLVDGILLATIFHVARTRDY